MDFVRKFVPGAQLLQSVGTESTILLPLTSTTHTENSDQSEENLELSKTSLIQLLSELEVTKDQYRVMSYGITDCTLEEVILSEFANFTYNQLICGNFRCS